MKNYSLFIGIDISKNWFDASITVNGHKKEMVHSKFDNTLKGFIKFMKWIFNKANQLGVKGEFLICMEHTGVYTLPLVAFLEQNNLDYVMESALRIKKSLGIRRGKDDKADSKDIAKYAFIYAKYLKISKIPAKNLVLLKSLLSHRARLVKQRTMTITASGELKKFTPKELQSELTDKHSKDLIATFNEQIKQTEKEILNIIKNDKVLKHLYDLVTSVKGVGPIIGATLLVFTNAFKAFKNARQFACFISIAPFAQSSGSSFMIPAKISKMGHKKIKALLSNGVNSAIQHDQQIRKYYQRKVAEGKSKYCVQNAIKNKMIARVFAVVKRGTPFVEFQY